MPSYVRKFTRTQTYKDALQQQSSGELWGRAHAQNGAFPCVQAYFGSLPPNVKGVEYDIVALPSAHAPLHGATVYWYQKPHGVADPVPGHPGFCFIQAKVTLIR